MVISFSANRKNFLTFRDVPKLGCYNFSFTFFKVGLKNNLMY